MKWSFYSAFWAVAIAAVVISWYAKDLPEIQGFDLANKRPSIVFLTRNHKEIATHGHLYGETITADKVPTYLIQALLATEDRRFFEHSGIDIQGLMRATLRNLTSGYVVQGGSTLTQQLAKNVFLTHERSFTRKIQEVILAVWLERHFSKEQILSIYLNRVYLGGGTFGVDAASQLYFGKLVSHLNLAECAIIAGLLKAPNRYARNHDLLRKRGIVVLHNMLQTDYITPKQFQQAKEQVETMPLQNKKMPNYRYFTDWVSGELENLVDTSQDLIVTTTLDDSLQEIATRSINQHIKTYGEKHNVKQASFLAMSYDGAVRALVGGAHYFTMQYNLATQARRQAGSAFKPVVYLAALEQHYPLHHSIEDTPYEKGGWKPRNYGWTSKGSVSMEDSLIYSINTATVRLAESVGLGPILRMAERLGLPKPQRNLSIALGTTEMSLIQMVNAFAVIANQGLSVGPYGILEIRNSQGKLLYKREPLIPTEVIEAPLTQKLSRLLEQVVERGTGKRAKIQGKRVAGKTGTTQRFRDAWFVGFVDQLAAGVWMGNPNEAPMNRVVGGNLPAMLWQKIMAQYLGA